MRDAIERYARLGYDVLVEPEQSDLPNFLQGFRPDLVAFAPSGEGGVVVELSTGIGARKREYMSALAERVRDQPAWRLDIVGIPPDQSAEDAASTQDLDRALGEARELIRSHREQAGLLMLWSTIEGALRARIEKAKLPVATDRPLEMLNALVSEGELDSLQYRAFRDAFELRSRWAHGLRAPVEGTDTTIQKALELAEDLMANVRSHSAGAS